LIGYVFHSEADYLLKYVSEGKIEGTGRQRRRLKQPLVNLRNETILEIYREALDRRR
jgi:hypothetical protein